LYVWSFAELSSAVASDRNSGVDLGDALACGGAHQRQPQPAVGGEGLLRGEVVDVRLADVDGKAAGAGRRVDQDETVADTVDRHHHAGRGLVVRPRDDVAGRVGDRQGRVAGSRVDDDRVLQERRRLRDLRELVGELAVAEVQRALAHQVQRRGVPEARRPAVAQRDLVVLGHAEQLAQPVAHARDDLLDGLLAV
jgi:hypothetical protein